MNFPELIKLKRLELKENQTEFGKRFNVSHASVSDWEAGKSEAPYKVLYFVLKPSYKLTIIHNGENLNLWN